MPGADCSSDHNLVVTRFRMKIHSKHHCPVLTGGQFSEFSSSRVSAGRKRDILTAHNI